MYHEVTIYGNVVADPTMRYTPGGTAVTNVTVATSTRIRKSEDEDNCPEGWKESFNKRYWEKTIFWRVASWRGLAETVDQYVTKGSPLLVVGEINGQVTDGTERPRIWETNEGEPRADYELTARVIRFGPRAERQTEVEEDEGMPW